MRRMVRATAGVGAEERLADAIAAVPAAQRALAEVADREDLPLVAGSWEDGEGGCLVANVVRVAGAQDGVASTLDLRVLELFPELSSRDLNRLIVAWDEAALLQGRGGDAALRRLLRAALGDRACRETPPPLGDRACRETETPPLLGGAGVTVYSSAASSVTSTSASSPSRT